MPLPGQRQFVRSLILELLPTIRRIEGCEEYRLFDVVDGDVLRIEKWSSREHWRAHFEAPAILRLKAELADRVVLPVERLELYEADDDDDGSRD
jgi:quinol monooxygenase YgiN